MSWTGTAKQRFYTSVEPSAVRYCTTNNLRGDKQNVNKVVHFCQEYWKKKKITATTRILYFTKKDALRKPIGFYIFVLTKSTRVITSGGTISFISNVYEFVNAISIFLRVLENRWKSVNGNIKNKKKQKKQKKKRILFWKAMNSLRLTSEIVTVPGFSPVKAVLVSCFVQRTTIIIQPRVFIWVIDSRTASPLVGYRDRVFRRPYCNIIV